MEISSVCALKAVSSVLYSPFSDQSHLQFYGHGSCFLAPSKLCFKMTCRSLSSVASKPLSRALCDSTCNGPVGTTTEEAMMKELSDLKLQMKQKKKELKSHMKDCKKKLKIQVKEKKMMKQKDAGEGKTKMMCQSELSSSSSESSDEECSSVSMKILRKGQSLHEYARMNNGGQSILEDARANEGGQMLEICVANSVGISSSARALSDRLDVCDGFCSNVSSLSNDNTERDFPSGRDSSEIYPSVPSMDSFDGCCMSIPKVISELEDVQRKAGTCGMMSSCKSAFDSGSGPRSNLLPLLNTSNRIEICAGGKCKKAGSQKLLLALQRQIPGSANVEVVACKCMGKCSMAINVRVLKEDATPQHHSQVGLEDGSLILSHHFGLGHQSVNVPCLSPKDGIRVPLSLATV